MKNKAQKFLSRFSFFSNKLQHWKFGIGLRSKGAHIKFSVAFYKRNLIVYFANAIKVKQKYTWKELSVDNVKNSVNV